VGRGRRSGITALFERCVIAWLRELSFAAVVRRMRITWDEIDGITMRAVERGMARRQKDIVRFIGIDEKSIRKRHKYFTIVSDLQSQKVLWIGRGRKCETIDAFWKTLTPEQLAGIEGISMDMWAPFFDSAVTNVPDGKSKIVFDKFHIEKYLGEALDQTRKSFGISHRRRGRLSISNGGTSGQRIRASNPSSSSPRCSRTISRTS
jgi:transposase